MKSIEERAKEFVKDFIFAENNMDCGDCDTCTTKCKDYLRYVDIVTEQKAIDEEVRLKKCDDMTEAEYNRETAFADWYHKNGKGTPTYSDAIEWARKDLLNKVCEWIKENFEHYIDVEVSSYYIYDKQFVEDFRKAMEE